MAAAPDIVSVGAGRSAQVSIDLAVPGRPIRSLVAEDQSAGGVRERTGPDPRSALGPSRTGTTRARAVTNGHQRRREVAARRPPAPPGCTTPTSGSGCGPDGRLGTSGQQTGSNRPP